MCSDLQIRMHVNSHTQSHMLAGKNFLVRKTIPFCFDLILITTIVPTKHLISAEALFSLPKFWELSPIY